MHKNMELIQALEKLKKSKKFIDLNKITKDIYFSYALIMLENNNIGPWHLGFYNKSTDKMITFIVDNEEIKMEKEEEIFKKPDMEVKQIDIEKVKIPYIEILKKAGEFQKKNYPNELTNKRIAVLQNLEDYGTVWNITYITNAFNTLNMKINAINGKILHHKLESLMSFVK